MPNKHELHSHAIDRLKERFNLNKSWLLNELENGRFVWLKGSGDSGNIKKVRSGHLFYIPNENEYCVVIIDDRSRLAITVLTEKMALKSPWGVELNEAAKLKAKRIALGDDAVDDCNFIRLYAEERGELLVNIQAKTIAYDWKLIGLRICKTAIKAEQIDLIKKICTLTDEQVNLISELIFNKINSNEIRPYCDLFVKTGHGKTAPISNKIDGVFCLEEAEIARRWGS